MRTGACGRVSVVYGVHFGDEGVSGGQGAGMWGKNGRGILCAERTLDLVGDAVYGRTGNDVCVVDDVERILDDGSRETGRRRASFATAVDHRRRTNGRLARANELLWGCISSDDVGYRWDNGLRVSPSRVGEGLGGGRGRSGGLRNGRVGEGEGRGGGTGRGWARRWRSGLTV